MRSENAKKNNAWIWTFCLISASLLQKQCAPVLDEKDKHFHEKVKCCLDAMKSHLILDIGVDWISRGCSTQRTSLLSAPLMSKYACIILKLLNTYTTKLGLTKVPPHCITASPVLEYWGFRPWCSYIMNKGTPLENKNTFRALGDNFSNGQKKTLFFWGCVP